MQETFTHHHILESIYDEITCCESIKLKEEILKNPNLAEEYRVLKQSKAFLDQNLLSPSPSSVRNILEMSKRKEAELV